MTTGFDVDALLAPLNGQQPHPVVPKRLYRRTDLGNAERLVDQHGENLRYCHPWKRWLVWEEQRWRPDDSGSPTRAAKLTVRSIYAEAGLVASDDEAGQTERKAISAWAAKSEAKARIDAMLSLAASEGGVVVLPDELDADPWLLNCANGTLNLRTGQLQPHNRDDLITKLSPVAYDPAATCPTWQQFLVRVMDGDLELVGFIQRALGYCLTGEIGEHCLFLPYGIGRNGKSVFLGAASQLLGNYAQQLPRDTLMARRGDRIPNDIARIAGARFATAIETRQQQRLDEELIKQLTGGDIVTARFLHAEFFEFRPVAKIWLATNHKPKVAGTDEGIWSRIRLIPFSVVIPEEERDPHLPARLEAELPGILRWAVEGCQAWQDRGLLPPVAVSDATDRYRAEEDTLQAFIEQCCEVGDSFYTYAKELHDAYQEFSGERLSQKAFGSLMRERSYDSARVGSSRRWAWFGLGLIGDSDGVNG